MKILVLCSYVPYPPIHGGRIRSGVMLRAWARDHEVVVAAPVSSADEATARVLESRFGVEVRALPSGTHATSPVHKFRNWLRGRSDVVWRRWTRAAIAEAHALTDAGGFDMAVADGTFSFPLISPRFQGHKILGLHNIEGEVVARLASPLRGFRAMPSRIESRLIGRLEARAALRCDLTVAVSEDDRRVISAAAPGARVEVVENSVDLDAMHALERPAPDPAHPVLLFVGSFDYPPNREAAYRILDRDVPALRREWPGARVRLVGSDPTHEIAKHAALVEGAEYVGFVDDLRDEYATATAVYVPLSSGGGTRIKVLEAFAYGRPVIATAFAVSGLAVEPGRHFLPCETPQQGVESLRKLLAGDADGMIHAGRRLVEERYSHRVTEARFAELLDSIG